jgi:hypothetical protein
MLTNSPTETSLLKTSVHDPRSSARKAEKQTTLQAHKKSGKDDAKERNPEPPTRAQQIAYSKGELHLAE